MTIVVALVCPVVVVPIEGPTASAAEKRGMRGQYQHQLGVLSEHWMDGRVVRGVLVTDLKQKPYVGHDPKPATYMVVMAVAPATSVARRIIILIFVFPPPGVDASDHL